VTWRAVDIRTMSGSKKSLRFACSDARQDETQMKRNIRVRSPGQCTIVLEMRDCEIGKPQMAQFANGVPAAADWAAGRALGTYDRCTTID
jgi:hypothetical protein